MKFKRFRINLFWKILFWFWLAFIVIFIVSIYSIQSDSRDTRFRPLPPPILEQLHQRIKKIHYLSKDKKLKSPRIKRLFSSVYLIGSNSKDYFGKYQPKLLTELHKNVLESNKPMLAIKGKNIFVGGLSLRIKNKNYFLYVQQSPSFLNRSFFHFFIRDFSGKLIKVGLLVSFPFSLLLAWLVVSPIRRLQKATLALRKDLSQTEELVILKNRRDEFADLAEDFQHLAIHLSEIIDSKNRLLSDVSHELRSPLARQKIAIALAENSEGKNESIIARIKLEGERLETMITGLLDYAQWENSVNMSQAKTFNVSQSIENLIADARFESEAKKLRINEDLTSGIYLTGVENYLMSGIENILRNAIRYAENEVYISIVVDGKQAMLTIQDDGIGVPESQLKKIFEAFYRPQQDRSRESGGVGLGLSIAKNAVELHSGQIMAENIRPNGLKISVSIPL